MEQCIHFDNGIDLSQAKHQITQKIAQKVEKWCAFYTYPQAKTIIESHLFPRFLRADESTNDRGLIYFLYGDYHTGKSFLCKFFAQLVYHHHPEYWELNDCPILHFNLDNHINTAKQLLIYLLDKLGRPIDSKVLSQWKRDGLERVRLQARVINLLEQKGTRILFLDECQKLLIARNPDLQDIFELLKDLSTKNNWNGKLRTQIVLCGTKDGIPLMESAEWIQGRTRTIQLRELSGTDFGSFLIPLYRDYLALGVSPKWDLMKIPEGSTKYSLNSERAAYLFGRTGGKIGLTVDLIRNAVLLALDEGRLYPEICDYEAIHLDQKAYVMPKTSDIFSPHKAKEKRKIRITYQDRSCQVEGCPKSKTPYVRYQSLIDHYRKKHGDVELIFEAGKDD